MSNPTNDVLRRPMRELGFVLAGIVGLAAIGIGAWAYLRPASQSPAELDEARQLLESIQTSTSASERLETAKSAEKQLVKFLRHESGHENAAKLLLLAARLVQGPIEDLELQVARVEFAAVPTSDLLTMAFVAHSRSQRATADSVISEALTRQNPADLTLRGPVLRLAAMIHYELGRSEEVLAHCDELKELAPDDPGPYRVMAFVFEDRQDTNQLAQTLRELIRRTNDPDDDPFQLQYIEALITLGQTADARHEFDALSNESSRVLADSPIVRAKLLELEGRLNDALAVAESVLTQRPDDVDAISLVARVHTANGDLENAIEQLQRILTLTPSDEKVHYQLGKILARQGQLDDAQTHLDRHRELLDTKVELNQLERVAAQRPADVEVRKRIASLYRRLGWEPEARFWDRAAEAATSFNQ